jgi:hypothetical protein
MNAAEYRRLRDIGEEAFKSQAQKVEAVRDREMREWH